jgi:hypothetical protein
MFPVMCVVWLLSCCSSFAVNQKDAQRSFGVSDMLISESEEVDVEDYETALAESEWKEDAVDFET